MATITIETLPVVDAIEAKMRETGMSGRAAAAAIGVTHVTLQNWRRGMTSPAVGLDAARQRGLAKFLGISPREVLALCGLDVSSGPLPSYMRSAPLGVVAVA